MYIYLDIYVARGALLAQDHPQQSTTPQRQSLHPPRVRAENRPPEPQPWVLFFLEGLQSAKRDRQGKPGQNPDATEALRMTVSPKAGQHHQALILLTFPRPACENKQPGE